ncbi:MAG: glycosyltransferase [Lachnospiraceae bacterium]|nr:glycosyltransferase [Lachnospiraceae bacterium]
MKPVVSVIFITYNHEKYVEKALRSVLEQKTDFDFEVVVGEDCSTDRTREIVSAVAAEYPDRVRLLFRDKNLGRPTLNVYETTMECRGDYLAYLEGDDFWTDPYKLQKQVDYLRQHPEYIGVTHSNRMIDENGQENNDPEALEAWSLYDWSGKYTYHDFQYSQKWPGHYATLLSRNIYHNEKFDYTILYRAHDFVDDAVILLFLLLQGDIYRMDETMAVWRFVKRKESGSWTSVAAQRDIAKDDCYLSKTLMQWIENYREISDYGKSVARRSFNLALSRYLKKPNAENKKFLRDMYDYFITHVILQDKKSSLFAYSIRAVFEKITGRNKPV